jgi:UDP-glucose 4-epimerase
LVTGAAGFIGSQLCERLVEGGTGVIGIDSFSPHYSPELKRLNLVSLATIPDFRLVNSGLAEAPLDDLVSEVDIVFHLAARPGVRDSWIDFEDYVDANIIGSRAIFDAAAKAGKRVVYASSSSVYGDAKALPVTEAHRLHPISPYGASKVMTEVLAGAYSSAYGLEAVGLRYFTVYGPRQRPDMGIARFVECMHEGRPISVYGDGQQRRDMTFVGDIVAATVLAGSKGTSGETYNVASGAPYGLSQILAELADVLGVKAKLSHEQAKPGDVRDTWADISKAASELGYAPRVTLREGLTAQAEEAEKRRTA